MKEQGQFIELDTKSITEGGVFYGYASRFNEIDLGNDNIQPGAFAQSLKTRPASKVKMLLAHDPTTPIGVWTSLVEDERGLKATGQLILDTAKGRETYALLRAGALDGLSIGFKAKKESYDRNIRLLHQVDLFEISVVTFPMLPSATVSQIKQANEFSRLVDAINRAAKALN
ncbi:HK97 family phage prohead protease [Bradyrhizobium sp. AZCC 1721]|uniref:HK97 family phage prohead protease n=1 Tax=Bradyrhizobium sp. AZCC 1721 TaxID=3117016 RepID=UPI002FEFD19E